MHLSKRRSDGLDLFVHTKIALYNTFNAPLVSQSVLTRAAYDRNILISWREYRPVLSGTQTPTSQRQWETR